jgi:hypothetical protein
MSEKNILDLYFFIRNKMDDTLKAHSSMQQHPETLQQKLAQIKLVHPITGETHSWQKSAYVKGLARKIHQTL